MTKLVRPCGGRAIASSMRTSVRVSTLLVASSRMRMPGLARKAWAIVSSWRCPEEMLDGASHDRDRLAGPGGQREVLDQRGVRVVAEARTPVGPARLSGPVMLGALVASRLCSLDTCSASGSVLSYRRRY